MEKDEMLNEILDHERVTTIFQPVVNLGTGDVIGYEALSRGPEGNELNSPLALLETARRNNKLCELESLFRRKAISQAENQSLDKLLFVNIDPGVIGDSKLNEEITKHLSKIQGIPPRSIVFEITEKTVMNNIEDLSGSIRQYCENGFNIAFDDIGGAFSNLFAISKVGPEYLKIDVSLVRGIDKSVFKQSLVKSFTIMASRTNIKLIAEGIETKEELKTLIRLGVYAGQGYYLGEPRDKIFSPDEKLVEDIRKFNNLRLDNFMTYSHIIGEICEQVKPFDENESCITVKNYLEKNRLEGVCVLSPSREVAGLLMKRHLDSLLSKQYGFELYADKPIKKVVDRKCLIVDYNTPIQTVAEQVFARNSEKTYDNIIVTKNSAYAGTVTVIKLLKYSMEIERNLALEMNPLTGLPGNFQIYNHMNAAIRSGKSLCVVYFDLNNFKVYNDLYGFERGDSIIRMTKDAICDTLNVQSDLESFVGHVGGDDFVAIIDCGAERCIEMCEKIIRLFDSQVPSFFNDKDRDNGFVFGQDRYSNCRSFPLTRISISGVCGKVGKFRNSGELSQYICEIKKQAKNTDKSAYVIEILQTGDRFSNIGKDFDQMSF